MHRDNKEFIDFTHQKRRDAVYFLEPKGAELLDQECNPKLAQVKTNYLHHRLDSADIRACLELALKETGGVHSPVGLIKMRGTETESSCFATT